ncbi:MAG TPA: Crp/Fnr family transcriptional regulator [Bryobacteraceae bacterium]|nr:Crp/Fnr family transcriptional regulator [Bryobacteraceae bacterium]
MPSKRARPGADSQSDMKLLAPLPPVEVYQAGVNLTSQGDVPPHVYFIVEGVVKLVHESEDGSGGIVELAPGGDLVGVHAALPGEECFETAVTLTRCRLARWRSVEFLARLAGDAGFSVGVCRVVCRQVRALRCSLLGSLSQSARQRFEGLVQFWLDHGLAGSRGSAGPFDLPLTRGELGALLSITAPHLSNLLAALEKEHVIARQGRLIRVLPAALRKSAAQRA